MMCCHSLTRIGPSCRWLAQHEKVQRDREATIGDHLLSLEGGLRTHMDARKNNGAEKKQF